MNHAYPGDEALSYARLLRLEPVQAHFWARQFDYMANTLLCRMGSGKAVKAWLAFPVVDGATAARIDFMPGVPACICLVRNDGHAMFLHLSRPALDERHLEEIAEQCAALLPGYIGGRAGWAGIEKKLRAFCKVSVTLRNIPLDAEYDSQGRLREYLAGRLFAGTRADPSVRERIIDVLQRRMMARLHGEILSLQRLLDVDVLRWMKQTRTALDLETYNRMLMLAPADARYRRQAFRIMPRLLRYLDEDETGPYTMPFAPGLQPAGNSRLILDAIDRGLPLFETLRHSLHLPEEVFRWLAKPDHARLAEAWPFDSLLLFNVLAAMAPEKRPVTEDQWHCLQRMLGVTRERHLPDRLATGWAADASRRGWASMVRKIATTPGYINELAQSADFFSLLALCVQSVASELPESLAAPEIGEISNWLAGFMSQSSMRRQLALSGNWHRLLAGAYGQMAAEHTVTAIAGSGPEAGWPALFETPVKLASGEIALCLNTTWQLVEEGKAMNHCVGGFTSRCMYEGSHIVSFRRGANAERLSTVELKLREGKGQVEFEVIQHHGHRNRSATPQHERLLQELLHDLARAEHQERLKQLLHAARLQQMQRCRRVVDSFTIQLMNQALAPQWSLQAIVAQMRGEPQVEPDSSTDSECKALPPEQRWLQRICRHIWQIFIPAMPGQ